MTKAFDYSDSWDESYGRRENHVFWPSDELVRFVSRHIRRRVGLDEFRDIVPGARGSRVLDAGCGIGRHLVFGHQMGLAMYGMDLSQVAVDGARHWLRAVGADDPDSRVVQRDIRALPWGDGFFDHSFSESALDSMPYSVAQAGIAEIARVTKPGGYFYCSLISGDETGRTADFTGDVLVKDQHEQNTIQSYFDKDRTLQLVGQQFETVSLYLVQIRLTNPDHVAGRWHFVGRRRQP